MKVLVVDDDENILFAFREVLEGEGFHCIEAKYGWEAVNKVKHDDPCIVFLDFSMTHTDGVQTMIAMKELNAKITVIATTTKGGIDEEMQRAEELGVFEVLTKPISVAKIRDTLKKANQQVIRYLQQ